MEIIGIRTEGLGDSSYLFVHDGVGVLVDPQRDVERFLAPLDDLGADLRFVLETHLHNDYVSGGREAARRTGAELVLPAAAAPAFRHTPAFHLEDLDGGPFTVRPIHTPGHTPEHTSYLVLIDGEPVAVFSGGSLLVGAAGRPDLLGPERADTLARLQYRSVHRLAALPDDVGLYPTHGAGSFCTATVASVTTSTIGQEKATNPVLAYPDEDSFVDGQLSGLVPYPRYYRHMGPANLYGPEPLPPIDVPELSPAELAAMDVEIVDTRPKAAYAAGHIPGSWGIEANEDFTTWAGWLLPYDAEIVFVVDDEQDPSELAVDLARIGFERIRGALRGMDAWIAEGRPVESHRTMTAREFLDEAGPDAQVLDVRAPNELDMGTLEGALHVFLPDLLDTIPEELDRTRPVYIGCTTGHRASAAAGLLAQAGYEPVVLVGASLLGVIMLQAQRAAAST